MRMNRLGRFKYIGEHDKILFLTHNDLDGTGAVLLNALFENVTVEHLTNAQMSPTIKNRLIEENAAKKYDTIIICDISMDDITAGTVAALDVMKKVILLDHHQTAANLNQYPWALVEPGILSGSFREAYYGELAGKAHSSGLSLLYDLLEYQGHTKRLPNLEAFQRYVYYVALYDTWDWHDLFDEEPTAKRLNTLFGVYSQNLFDRRMREKLEKANPCLFDETDEILLEIEEENIKQTVERAVFSFKCGSLKKDGREYSICFTFGHRYLNDIFEKMKKEHPGMDLYIINYGTGVSLRTERPEINVASILETLGGGGHPAAGGVGAPKKEQRLYTERLLGGKIWVDLKG